jgi:hypothetical protein
LTKKINCLSIKQYCKAILTIYDKRADYFRAKLILKNENKTGTAIREYYFFRNIIL